MARRSIGISFLAVLSAVVGCGTAPTRYYVLPAVAASAKPPAPRSEAPSPAGKEESPPATTIILGPVEIPGYLDRVQLVRRTLTNRIEIAEFDRWAEPLRVGIARVLTLDLEVRLPGTRVLPYAGRPADVDVRVVLDIRGFEPLGGAFGLSARWSLLAAGGATLRTAEYFRLEPFDESGGHDAAITAASKVLAALADEIAAAIRERKDPPR